jgi:hypothetical protein
MDVLPIVCNMLRSMPNLTFSSLFQLTSFKLNKPTANWLPPESKNALHAEGASHLYFNDIN